MNGPPRNIKHGKGILAALLLAALLICPACRVQLRSSTFAATPTPIAEAVPESTTKLILTPTPTLIPTPTLPPAIATPLPEDATVQQKIEHLFDKLQNTYNILWEHHPYMKHQY